MPTALDQTNRTNTIVIIAFCIIAALIPKSTNAKLNTFWVSVGISIHYSFSEILGYPKNRGTYIGLEISSWQDLPKNKFLDQYYFEIGADYCFEEESILLYPEIGSGPYFMGAGIAPFIGWNFSTKKLIYGIQDSFWVGFIFGFLQIRPRYYLDYASRQGSDPNEAMDIPIGIVGKFPIYQNLSLIGGLGF